MQATSTKVPWEFDIIDCLKSICIHHGKCIDHIIVLKTTLKAVKAAFSGFIFEWNWNAAGIQGGSDVIGYSMPV
jgi:hypothetical protein